MGSIYLKMALPSTIILLVLTIHRVLSRHHHHHHHHLHHHHKASHHEHPLSDEYINSINSAQSLWTAGRNFHRDTPLEYIRGLSGTIIDSNFNEELPENTLSCDIDKLPVYFDARQKWSYCKSMVNIRDQGGCGSCWAVGVASVMSDRICILTTHTEKVTFSDEDILTCCHDCLLYNANICAGGLTDRAWAYVKRNGVVSGGNFNTTGGCKSYEFRPCKHTDYFTSEMRKCKAPAMTTQKCTRECTSNKELDYNADKRRFTKTYRVMNPMCEIFNYGPIAAIMNVHNDFLHYKKGIYRHTIPHYGGVRNHTVKIVGWGEENSGSKYWIVANSWGVKWGENGYFKIVRGENDCNIEAHMTAAKI